MVSPITTAKIFSTLGNNSSLVPLGVKDVSNSLGITTGSYITGSKIEGKDRLIDEFGTQAIWLLGIPFFKKVIDKTVYKLAKFNPNVDTRILNNKDIFKKAIEHAPEDLKAGFEKIAKNQNLFKGLAMAKFIAATALTLGSYSALTIFRHKNTEKAIIKELKNEENAKRVQNNLPTNPQKSPTFGMNLAPLKQFMFDPVKNTMIIDGGITTQRLTDSRNPQDFMGYVIKEGGFWAFMYFAGPAVQKYLEKRAAKNGKPIDLDIRVLLDNDFQKEIGNMTDKKIKEMSAELKLDKTDAEIYESLFKNSNNLIVKVAKQSDIIKTINKKDENGKKIAKELLEIDTQHYIDIDTIKGIKEKIENLHQNFKKQSKEGIEDFFKGLLKLKRASIIKNILASIGTLGLVVPAIMVTMRMMDKENKEFAVKKQVYEKLKQQNSVE